MLDKRVIACNQIEATSEVSAGSLCYLDYQTHGALFHGRIRLYARSRSGRWISKYEHIKRLGNFRVKNLPPEHPLYGRALDFGDHAESIIANLTAPRRPGGRRYA